MITQVKLTEKRAAPKLLKSRQAWPARWGIGAGPRVGPQEPARISRLSGAAEPPPHLLSAAARGRSPSPPAPGPPGGRRPAAAARRPGTWRRGLDPFARSRTPQPFPPSMDRRGAYAGPRKTQGEVEQRLPLSVTRPQGAEAPARVQSPAPPLRPVTNSGISPLTPPPNYCLKAPVKPPPQPFSPPTWLGGHRSL